MDKSNDGTLSKEELRRGLEEVYGGLKGCEDIDFSELVEKMDMDGTGKISYSEFLVAATNR